MLNIGIKLFDGSLYSVGDVYSFQGAEVVITTIADFQRIAEVELYLIDEKQPHDAPFIGKFTIRDIPEAQAGSPRFTLIIKADKSANLNVLVYDKGKLSGKMDIPALGWHPDFKSKTASHVTMAKKDGEGRRDFEVHFKSEKESPQPKAESAPVLPKVPREENTHFISKEESGENNSGGSGLFIGALSVIAIIVVIILVILRPWSGETPQNGIAKKVNVSQSDSSTSSQVAEKTPETESTTITVIAQTPLPTVDPREYIASINTKIQGISDIYFEPNTTRILDNSMNKLPILASLLAEYKGIIRVEVIGHTAQIGTENEQFELSVDRAKLIATEMINRNAIDKDSISWRGVGASNPATTDINKMELNRRVEVEAFLK